MPLRSKHVRRLTALLLFVVLFLPLVGLGTWAVWVERGGPEAALEKTLARRLGCEAQVVGLRPTGIETAALETVTLTWTAHGGTLRLGLQNVAAESNAYGWYVRAGRGNLDLSGPTPRATLGALNDRLVQRDAGPHLVSFSVERLATTLDLGQLRVEAPLRAVALAGSDRVYEVSVWPTEAYATWTRPVPPAAVLRLDATSDRGVFDALRLSLTDIPAANAVSALTAVDLPVETGAIDVEAAWNWPAEGGDEDARRTEVVVTGRSLALEEWTGDIVGGPLTGPADGKVTVARTPQGPAWMLEVISSEGSVSASTLRAAQAAVPNVEGYGAWLSGRIGYTSLWVNVAVTPDGRARLADEVGLITTSLFNEDIPLLWCDGAAFDAQRAWQALIVQPTRK